MCTRVIRYRVTTCIPPVLAPPAPECQAVQPLTQSRQSLLPGLCLTDRPVLLQTARQDANSVPVTLQTTGARQSVQSQQVQSDGEGTDTHGSGMSRATTASPKPSFRALWRMGNAVVGRGNAGWTTSKSGHPCQCQNCSQQPPTEKTGRGSLLNRP